MKIKGTLLVILLLASIQTLESLEILKIYNYSGWNIPDINFFKCDRILENLKNYPSITIKHYVLKESGDYYYLNNKISRNGYVTLSEKIDNFELEMINRFDILSDSNNKFRIYRIFCLSTVNAKSIYQNQMELKKYGVVFDSGIESSIALSYFILDFNNDGIYETKINFENSEFKEEDNYLYDIIKDFLNNRTEDKLSDRCMVSVKNLKRKWFKFVKDPSNDSLKEVYISLPEKRYDIFLEKIEKIRKKIKCDTIIEQSNRIIDILKEWKNNSIFCEGSALDEEKQLLKHISENLQLISREFLYGNPYALPLAFKLFPIISGDNASDIDNMLIDFCLIRPEDFLKYLKKCSYLINIDQALDNTIGYEKIGLLNFAKREIEILLNTIKGVKNIDLKDIRDDCIKFLKKRKREFSNN